MGKWEMVRLGDVCEFINGDRGINYPSKKDFIEAGVPFINAGHLSNKSIDFSEMNYISIEKFMKLGSGKVRNGDILYCLRGSLGKQAIVEDIDVGAIASSLVIMRPLSEVAIKYLSYCLESSEIFRQQLQVNTGSSQPNLSATNVKNYLIPLPPLDEQKRIAKNLDLAREIVKGYKEQLAELDKLVQSVFYEMFGDPVINEKGWKKQSWKLVFNTTTGKLDSNAMVENGEYPFFTCAKEQFWIDEYAFDCEALLLAGNNAAGIYDIKYYNGKFNAYQRTYVLTLKNNTYSYRLFKFQLESKLQLLKQQSKGTNTRYLTLGILNELDFIIPPLPLQICFASIVADIEAQKSQVQTALEQAQNLFNSLMQEYFE